jgi:hypothetical protein
MSNPAVMFGSSLLPSVMGRSSFHLGLQQGRARISIADPLRVLRTWGVGLLISSSESPQKAKFAEIVIGEVRRIILPRTRVHKGTKREIQEP